MTASVEDIERLAHRTWPCRAQEMLGDWILREASGFTRRANSCLAIGDPGMALGCAVDRVEAWYRTKELEPCIKITPASHLELDGLLEKRGWNIATPTRTLVRELEPELPPPPAELVASAIPDTDWLRTVSLWDSESSEKARQHAELALRISSAGYLRWKTERGVLAVGLVALVGSESFLYDVVVHPEARGQGVGRAFCRAAIAWSASCGSRTMALQVLDSNLVARGLYASLGFSESHPYHYRIAPSEHRTCGC